MWVCPNCGESWDITDPDSGARWDRGEAATVDDVARGAGCIACEGTLGYPGRPRSPLSGGLLVEELEADGRCTWQLADDHATGDVRCGDPAGEDSLFCPRHTDRALDETGEYPQRLHRAEDDDPDDGAVCGGCYETDPERLVHTASGVFCDRCLGVRARACEQASADIDDEAFWEAGAMRWRPDDTETPGGSPAGDGTQPEGSPSVSTDLVAADGGTGEGYTDTVATLQTLARQLQTAHEPCQNLADNLTANEVDAQTITNVSELMDALDAAAPLAVQTAGHMCRPATSRSRRPSPAPAAVRTWRPRAGTTTCDQLAGCAPIPIPSRSRNAAPAATGPATGTRSGIGRWIGCWRSWRAAETTTTTATSGTSRTTVRRR